MIPYGRQDIDEHDIHAVLEVLQSDLITQGPIVPRFEQAVAGYCGARYGVAVNSGTSALHIACRAIGLGPGDSLWTSPNTFVASSNCALYCGATAEFVDIDPRTYNISVDRLVEKLSRAAKEGRLPKVVVPVHFAGQSCDMDAIAELSKKYGFFVIEDASHALGGDYQGGKIGSCAYSDMTVFSFHPVKIITTGEGGMVTTNDPELSSRMKRLRSHGITRDPAEMVDKLDGQWYYQQIDLGYNYRLTDFQAALGLSQLRRLDEFVARRRSLAERYTELLRELPLRTPWQDPDTCSAWHLYVIRLNRRILRKTRRQVFDSLRREGIGVNVHYIPVHTQPYYRKLGFQPGDFPEAEAYYEEAISLPLYPTLGLEQQDFIISTLKSLLI